MMTAIKIAQIYQFLEDCASMKYRPTMKELADHVNLPKALVSAEMRSNEVIKIQREKVNNFMADVVSLVA